MSCGEEENRGEKVDGGGKKIESGAGKVVEVVHTLLQHSILILRRVLHLSHFTIVLRLTQSYFIHVIVSRCAVLSEVEKAEVLVF